MLKTLRFSALPVLAALLVLGSCARDATGGDAVHAGTDADSRKAAPDFILKDEQGRDVRLSDFK